MLLHAGCSCASWPLLDPTWGEERGQEGDQRGAREYRQVVVVLQAGSIH